MRRLAVTPEELSKLDYAGAQDMLTSYATTLKLYEKDIEQTRSESLLWRQRADAAAAKGASVLEQTARQQADELDRKLHTLEAEAAVIRRDVEQLREALPLLKAKQRAVDPDALLAELSMITGVDPDAAANIEAERKALDQSAVEAELAALKKKMGL